MGDRRQAYFYSNHPCGKRITHIVYQAKNEKDKLLYIGQTQKTLQQRKQNHLTQSTSFTRRLDKEYVDADWEWSVLWTSPTRSRVYKVENYKPVAWNVFIKNGNSVKGLINVNIVELSFINKAIHQRQYKVLNTAGVEPQRLVNNSEDCIANCKEKPENNSVLAAASNFLHPLSWFVRQDLYHIYFYLTALIKEIISENHQDECKIKTYLCKQMSYRRFLKTPKELLYKTLTEKIGWNLYSLKKPTKPIPNKNTCGIPKWEANTIYFKQLNTEIFNIIKKSVLKKLQEGP